MGATTLVQYNMEVSESKPNSKNSSNKVMIVWVEEVDFCIAVVGEVPGNKICSLMKVVDRYCNKYKTHAGKDKGDIDSVFYLTPNGTDLFLKPLVSLNLGDENQEFLSQVVEDLSNYTDMDIMNEVNHTMNASTEVF